MENKASHIPKSMKALLKTEEVPSFRYVDLPVPEPKDDEVLIKVDAVSICGSDINLYKWNDIGKIIGSAPCIPGHECAGTVVKVGPKASLPLGSKVGVENLYFCGDCFQCKNGQREMCRNLKAYGHGEGKGSAYGGCAEYSIVPEKYLYRIIRDLNPDQITMLEPLGVSHNAIEKLEVENEDVLIIGCGPIGVLAVAAAKALGARQVIAADIFDQKLTMATQMGADLVVNTKKTNLSSFVANHTNGLGMGRICECSGAPEMVNNMFSWIRKGGKLMMVALPKEPLKVENVLNDFVFKSLTLRSIHGRQIYRTWELIENLVAEGKIDVTKVITHRFPLSKFEEAYKVLMNGESCKVVMYPGTL